MASKMLLLPPAGTELAALNCGRSRGAGRRLRGFEAYIDDRARGASVAFGIPTSPRSTHPDDLEKVNRSFAKKYVRALSGR